MSTQFPSPAVLFVRAMLARAYPRLMWLVRQPGWIFQEVVLPVLAVSAFVYVYRALHAREEYVGYVVLGGAMTAFWLNVLWSMGAQLYWERDSGNLELYIMAPCSMMAILAGMALGGMALTCIRAAAIFTAGVILFQVPFAPTDWPLLVAVFLLTILALYGLGMVFASTFLLWGREAWHLVNLLQEPVYLASGLNFPVKLLGTAVASVAALIPLTVGVDALRQLLFNVQENDRFLPVGWEVAILAVLSVLFLVLARWCLGYLERRARQEGRISVRWQ